MRVGYGNTARSMDGQLKHWESESGSYLPYHPHQGKVDTRRTRYWTASPWQEGSMWLMKGNPARGPSSAVTE